MEYQKTANLLDNEVAPNISDQPSKFKTRNWVKINNDSRGTYTGADIKFKTLMLKCNLYDYADAQIFVKGKITITGPGNYDAGRRADERDKEVIFKNCAPFTKCMCR